MKSAAEKATTICFRTSETLKSQLEALALKDSRTLTSFLEVTLKKVVEASNKKK